MIKRITSKIQEGITDEMREKVYRYRNQIVAGAAALVCVVGYILGVHFSRRRVVFNVNLNLSHGG